MGTERKGERWVEREVGLERERCTVRERSEVREKERHRERQRDERVVCMVLIVHAN